MDVLTRPSQTAENQLKLGTRRSLLAWAQSSWVASELERLNSGLSVELVGIDTRGDKILDIPLSQVEGKEFFVQELDNALRSKEVDFTVHSLKDLSLERPADFDLVCIPERENPRDVIIFGRYVIDKLMAGKAIRIGSSSPRRLENLPPFLKKALPRFPSPGHELEELEADGAELPEPHVQFVEIRGNVNTRLGRLHEPDGSDRHLDGVVLALAGLIRLWRDEKARPEMKKLFQGTHRMILPLKQNPTAPGQGALAVECRRNDLRVRDVLLKLHHPQTRARVEREREVLREWGGGCHQKFGATCIEASAMGEIFYLRGTMPDGKFVDETQHPSPARPTASPSCLWDGSFWRGHGFEWIFGESELEQLDAHKCVFVAHSRAVPGDWDTHLRSKRVWTSGAASWYRLAQLGVWVEGCTEGFGFDDFRSTLEQEVLGLDPVKSWAILTHAGGADTWREGGVIATYRVVEDREAAAREALKQATHVYWGSASQCERYWADVPPQAHHACGPGKTARHLAGKGLKPTVFLSSEEWRKWLAK